MATAVLNDIVRRGDVHSFEDLRFRVNNRGNSPAPGHSRSPMTAYPTPPSYPAPGSYGQPYGAPPPGGAPYRSQNMTPQRNGAPPRPSGTGRCMSSRNLTSYMCWELICSADFKHSPFHEVIDTLSPLQDLPGKLAFTFSLLSSALTILMQSRQQKCHKIDIPSRQRSQSLHITPRDSDPTATCASTYTAAWLRQ